MNEHWDGDPEHARRLILPASTKTALFHRVATVGWRLLGS